MKLSFLLFAQVACTANVAVALNNNKEGSEHSLRGGATTTSTENHRSLYDVMDLAPGASGCSLHSSNDGTYVCGVRSFGTVSDSGLENHLACVTIADGSQKCANIGLADGPGAPGMPGSGFPGGPGVPGVGSFGTGPSDSNDSVSGDALPPLPPGLGTFDTGPSESESNDSGSGDTLPPPPLELGTFDTLSESYDSGSGDGDFFEQPGPLPGSYDSPSNDIGPPPAGGFPVPGFPDHNGGLMPNQGGGIKCPGNKPTSGTHCCGWIPSDAVETSCYYNGGVTQCNCGAQDNECGTTGWSCRGVPPPS